MADSFGIARAGVKRDRYVTAVREEAWHDLELMGRMHRVMRASHVVLSAHHPAGSAILQQTAPLIKGLE